MKRIVTLLTALLLAALCSTALMEVKGHYVWHEHPIEVTTIEHFTKITPKNIKENEYFVALSMTVEESIWKDKDKLSAICKEAVVADPQGNTYSVQLSGKGVDSPIWVLFYIIPKSVSMEDLSFSPGENGQAADAPAEPAEQPADAPAVLTAESGASLTLTPVDAGQFRKQDDNVVVHTRIGDTNHNSGSTFTAGSGLRLSNMRNTKQYDMPMVAFTYESSLEFDLLADAVGAIGQKAVLTLDGKTYAAKLAWITKGMACLIFDCPALPDSAMRFQVKDNTLFIEP